MRDINYLQREIILLKPLSYEFPSHFKESRKVIYRHSSSSFWYTAIFSQIILQDFRINYSTIFSFSTITLDISNISKILSRRFLTYLSDKDVKRLKKYLKAYKKLIGEPVYSIYAARQENPNAYDPWTEEADDQLRQMWEDGTSVAEIAQHFGRKQSAVIVRMKKLGI